jgi:histone deacetylase 11
MLDRSVNEMASFHKLDDLARSGFVVAATESKQPIGNIDSPIDLWLLATIDMHISPKVVYTPGYDIHFLGLEKLHPFDSCKYSRTWKSLQQIFGDRLQQSLLAPNVPAPLVMLQAVHTDAYLQQLQHSRFVAKALELKSLELLPIGILDRHVLKSMRLATAGTVLAAASALEHGMSVNLSGGYHHASQDSGEGFCIYADIAIAIATLRQSGQLCADDAILIIDLDAHQGNGLARIFDLDPSVHILDMYNYQIYPNDVRAQARIDCNLPLPSGTRDDRYLGTLKEHLPLFLSQIERPKIAFYNAGTDIYERDPLGQLQVSQQGILDRDRLVFETLTGAGIPWVMVPSGGYTKESYQLVANSVAYMLHTWQ